MKLNIFKNIYINIKFLYIYNINIKFLYNLTDKNKEKNKINIKKLLFLFYIKFFKKNLSKV